MTMLVKKITISFFLLAVVAMAQVDRATLNGTVTDSSGAVVPGAVVVVTQPETGFRREVATGAAGTYSLTALPIGNYTVRVTSSGMKTSETQSVKLDVGQTRTQDVVLQVGELSNVVSVDAAATPLDQSTAEVGGTIESRQANEIPLHARQWAGLMPLVPGAQR